MSLDVFGEYHCEVLNLIGEVVANDRFSSFTRMDLSGLASGLYSVRVSTENASTTWVIILE